VVADPGIQRPIEVILDYVLFFMPTVTVEVIFLVNFDFLAWNKLNGMIISPQNVALLYLVLVFSQFVLLLDEM
jgi:hypothetical protein